VNREIEVALKMEGITKSFPGVIANNGISLEIRAGEVHGLLGENGAGKTTLMNILFGLHHPDQGEIYLNQEKVKIASPRDAVDLGIGMVHQHFMLIDNLTALENVILGISPRHPPLLDVAAGRERFEQLAKEYQLHLEPSTPVWQLPVGDQQWLEILKQLFRDVKIIILDEPTAVLAPSQVRQLFRIIRQLVDEGRSVIFISHKLDEVLEVTDRITVLRDGRVMGTINTIDATPPILAQMMVGRPVSLDRKARAPVDKRTPVLRVRDLQCSDDRGTVALNKVDLTVHSGEIVGIAGVDGNGQRELAECITGLRKPTTGTIKIGERTINNIVSNPSIIGHIPEDRRKTGLVADFSVAENLIIRVFRSPPFTKNGIMQWDVIQAEAQKLISEYEIKTPDPSISIQNLSGGNQQRVVVARELKNQPLLIVASQPTRGLDLGAVEAVHQVLLKERNRGAAVLFISAELSEVMAISDRIVVMFKGEIMGDVEADGAELGTIGELMLGHQKSVEETGVLL